MSIEELFESDFKGDGDGDGDGEGEGEEEECFKRSLEVQISRTMALIIDYKMFNAARLIQSFWRAHRERKLRHQRWQAAIAIQRSWRGFRLRRQLWDLVERRLQQALLDHLNLMATRIQALFRGWYARRFAHDMVRLTRIQTAATEDLVHGLIQILHHLKRTEHLPGVVSIQETLGISKIEKLVTTMSFRFHNGRMTSMVSGKMAKQAEARQHFRDCRFMTHIPYAGLDLSSHLTYKSAWNVGNELLDPRMNDIATDYEAFQRSEYLRNLHPGLHKRKEYLQNIRNRERRDKEDFCNSVIGSMHRCAEWNEFNFEVKNVLRSPNGRESFFKKMGVVLEKHGMNCNCVPRVFPAYNCPDLQVNTGRYG